jgi:hypothetical protein
MYGKEKFHGPRIKCLFYAGRNNNSRMHDRKRREIEDGIKKTKKTKKKNDGGICQEEWVAIFENTIFMLGA